jgi:hypothetical protein
MEFNLAGDQETYRDSQQRNSLPWSEKLRQGRRWRKWCKLLSGVESADLDLRGGLLALLVVETANKTSAWSIARKKLTDPQFELCKIFIDRYLQEKSTK